MPANIKQVAEAAKVSTATVSHVINKTRNVTEETRNRVLHAMKELEYYPSSIARSLRSQKTNIIGLLMPIMVFSSFDYYFMRVAHGINETFKNHGYTVILGSSNNNVKDEVEQIQTFNSKQIDGLIILPVGGEHKYLGNFLSGDYPVVFIDRRAQGYEGDCVLADNFQGAYDAVTALIQKGHIKIGCISNSLKVTTVIERLEGYKKALTDHGIKVDESLIEIGDYKFENGYTIAEYFMTEQDVTALFIADNLLLMGAMEYFQHNKISIPERVAIIGFDDFEWERITNPPLSVVKQPSYNLGKKAAEVMIERLNNTKKDYKEYRLPTELVIRESF